jgi:hypothetical protein
MNRIVLHLRIGMGSVKVTYSTPYGRKPIMLHCGGKDMVNNHATFGTQTTHIHTEYTHLVSMNK